jgi:hypothetical protein
LIRSEKRGAAERKPPIQPLRIEIIEAFSAVSQRFVACFVARETISNTRIRRRTMPHGCFAAARHAA